MLLPQPVSSTKDRLTTNNALNRNKMDIGEAKLTLKGKTCLKKIIDQIKPVKNMIIRSWGQKKDPETIRGLQYQLDIISFYANWDGEDQRG
jgi:hypothetical protein